MNRILPERPADAANNVNGIGADTDGDGVGLEYFMLCDDAMGKRVLELQRAYLGHGQRP